MKIKTNNTPAEPPEPPKNLVKVYYSNLPKHNKGTKINKIIIQTLQTQK